MGPSAQGSLLSWNILYEYRFILGALASGCLGKSGGSFVSRIIPRTFPVKVLMMGPLRLDTLCENNQCSALWRNFTASLTDCVTAVCGPLITSKTATLIW